MLRIWFNEPGTLTRTKKFEHSIEYVRKWPPNGDFQYKSIISGLFIFIDLTVRSLRENLLLNSTNVT